MNQLSTFTGEWSAADGGDCPVGNTLRLLGGKHGASVLHCLLGGEMHFLELQRALAGVSRKVLNEQLRAFIEAGLIIRMPKTDALRRVGYSLSPKGRELAAILDQLVDWSRNHKLHSNSISEV